MNIAVYCGAQYGNDPAYQDAARAVGTWIGSNGHTLVYGGCFSGLMGVVADAVLSEGGKAIGVLVDVPSIQEERHPNLSAYFETRTFPERKTKMNELADAHIALPGGPGTFDEVGEIINLIRAEVDIEPLAMVDVLGFYQPMKAQLEAMVEKGFSSGKVFDHVLISDDLEQVFTFVAR